MITILKGATLGLCVYVFFVLIYGEGYEAGRDHQLKIDCEARGFVFHNRICWAMPQETELRGTL